MHIKPKKSLGQNFLVDRNIRGKILNACGLNADDTVLEIGAGKGELTELIAERVKFVYALEIDKRFFDVLISGPRLHTNIKFINADILKFDLSKIKPTGGKLIVFGNIPYYISSPIIEHMFKYRKLISDIFLTVQKEFAERVVASAGTKTYGSFSCFAQYYSSPKIIFNISKGCFRPQPKVDSAFLRLSIRKDPPVSVDDENNLFRVIRAAFNKRRKTLRNSLEGILPKAELEDFLLKNSLDKNIRPERLTLEEFAKLSNMQKKT